MSNAILSISLSDLSSITGGAGGTFADYTSQQRDKVAEPYRQVVCTTAGIKGAPDLAKGVYGTGASDTDKIRAAQMLNTYCLGGASLPEQAPKSPF